MSDIGNLIHKGSVKDIYKSREKDQLVFKFSDRYSVFDWGQMPDLLEKKGSVLALLGGLFFKWLEKPSVWKNWRPDYHLEKAELEVFEKLKKVGLQNHYVGQISDEPETMVVREVRVPKLPEERGTYDYSVFNTRPLNTLVPLEVIFRFGVPQGSSLLKRVGDQDYLRVLGLKNEPKAGEWLSRPILEFSTKLESTDRYLKYDEAQQIAGLNDLEFSQIYARTTLLAMRLSDLFKELGISLWDGKFEWAFGGEDKESGARDFTLVDSIGPDELRLSYKDQQLSKEFLRGFYRGSSWLAAVEKAKEIAKKERTTLWKQYVEQGPMPLTNDFKQVAEGLYLSLANSLNERVSQDLNEKDKPEGSFLEKAPSLAAVVSQMEGLVVPGDKR